MAEQLSDNVARATFQILERMAKEAGAIGAKAPQKLVKSVEAKLKAYDDARAAKLSKAETAKRYDEFLAELGKLRQTMIDKGLAEPEQLEDPIATLVHQDMTDKDARTDSEGNIVVNEKLDNAKENIEKAAAKNDKSIGDEGYETTAFDKDFKERQDIQEAILDYKDIEIADALEDQFDDPDISDKGRTAAQKGVAEAKDIYDKAEGKDAEEKLVNANKDMEHKIAREEKSFGQSVKSAAEMGVDVGKEAQEALDATKGISKSAEDTLSALLNGPDRDLKIMALTEALKAKGAELGIMKDMSADTRLHLAKASKGAIRIDTLGEKLRGVLSQHALDSLAIQKYEQARIIEKCDKKINELQAEKNILKHEGRQKVVSGIAQAFTGKESHIDSEKANTEMASRYERKIEALLQTRKKAQDRATKITEKYNAKQKEYVARLDKIQDRREANGTLEKDARKELLKTEKGMERSKGIDKRLETAKEDIDQRAHEKSDNAFIQNLSVHAAARMRRKDTRGFMKDSKDMSHGKIQKSIGKFENR